MTDIVGAGEKSGDFLVVNRDTGAYTPYGMVVPIITATQLPGPYKVPNYRSEFTVVYTNTPCVSPYRGAGRPHACFVMERLIDRIARELRRAADLSEAQAMMVARTEVVSAANAGAARRIDLAASAGDDVPALHAARILPCGGQRLLQHLGGLVEHAGDGPVEARHLRHRPDRHLGPAGHDDGPVDQPHPRARHRGQPPTGRPGRQRWQLERRAAHHLRVLLRVDSDEEHVTGSRAGADARCGVGVRCGRRTDAGRTTERSDSSSGMMP